MKNYRRIAAVMFALAAALWPHIAVGSPTIGAGRSVVTQTAARSSLSQGHLYVLDLSKAVYRFPLAQDGLPGTQPDSVMYPEGAIYPTGLAVDKVGHIFIADGNGWGSAVAEFAAGATGPQQPISTLYANLPTYLKLDSAERLFVYIDGIPEIGIFAKGAHGHDAPISIVSTNGFVTDYTISKSEVLYVLYNANPVAVYNEPLKSPSKPDRIIKYDGNFYEFGTTLALDESTDRLFIQFSVGFPQYWNKVNYDVRPASGSSVPFARVPWIFTADCGPKNSPIVGSTLIIKKYLIFSCNSFSEVLVYRKDMFGRQRAPVEAVGQGTLISPVEMAVGP